jgi:hypothetical protein
MPGGQMKTAPVDTQGRCFCISLKQRGVKPALSLGGHICRMEKPSFGRTPSGPPIPPKRRLETSKPAPVPDSVADELHAWKSERARPAFPWRPFLLMAGICFLAGSLVLPDSVNNAASWTLYVLTGISFFIGLRRRRSKV